MLGLELVIQRRETHRALPWPHLDRACLALHRWVKDDKQTNGDFGGFPACWDLSLVVFMFGSVL